MGALKLILINIVLLASVGFAVYIVKQTHSCDCLNKILFFDLQNLDLATEAGKWSLLRSLLAKISLYLFVHAIIVMTIRIFTGKSSPATQEDPTAIKVINRIITNSIEQSIVFVGLYTYFLFDKSGDRFNNIELTVFASWFLLARVAFSASYLIGSIIGLPSLRGFGFALNVATILFLIELSFSPQTPLTTFFFEK